MRIITLLLTFISFNALCQTVIWSEDFETYTDGTQNATKWTTNADNCDDNNDLPGTINGNYWGVETTNGNKEFRVNDIEGLTCCGTNGGNNDNLFETEVIDISAYNDISLSISVRAYDSGGGKFECGGCNAEDRLTAQYRVDGGIWNTFLDICGVENNYENIGCIDVSAGSDLEIRILVGNQANDENYYFDDIIVYDALCSVVLPIELISFEAMHLKESGVNIIEWVTLTENNNDYFILEHSADGIHFSTIKTLDGAGYSYLPKYYSQTHRTNENEIDYYRLTQVDYDGKYETFDIISLNNEFDKDIVEINYYNIMGQKISKENAKGIVILEYIFKNGKVTRNKIFI